MKKCNLVYLNSFSNLHLVINNLVPYTDNEVLFYSFGKIGSITSDLNITELGQTMINFSPVEVILIPKRAMACSA